MYRVISDEIGKLFVGQDELVLGSLTALFAGGHVLIESVPGLGKTLFVRTIGRVLGCECGRIQFTADLMPSDITGAPVYDMQKSEFRFRPGPIFTQFLLADEINRSPAKTHAALLEIMQEYRVTVDGTSHAVPKPFLVLATQNPLESEGTYNLPEAQLDRFMFKLHVHYPTEQQEAEIRGRQQICPTSPSIASGPSRATHAAASPPITISGAAWLAYALTRPPLRFRHPFHLAQPFLAHTLMACGRLSRTSSSFPGS